MRKHKILLALSEDDPSSPGTVGSALDNWGYKVTLATGNGSASEALETKKFDLVITNRLDVLKKAKEVDPETVVVILSETCKATFAIRALRLHADDYLLLPIDLVDLRNVAAHYLGKRLKQNRRITPPDEMNSDMLKMMSEDIRQSLVSISATLNLLSRGYCGSMDKGVAKGLEEALLKTLHLVEVTEEYLERTSFVDRDLEAECENLELMKDINPVLDEIPRS